MRQNEQEDGVRRSLAGSLPVSVGNRFLLPPLFVPVRATQCWEAGISAIEPVNHKIPVWIPWGGRDGHVDVCGMDVWGPGQPSVTCSALTSLGRRCASPVCHLQGRMV